MSHNIDDLLKPDNLEPNKKPDKSNDVKSRLADLKEALKSDPIQLDTDDILFSNDVELPESLNSKYVDYTEEKKNHKEFAEQVITNIIETYVKTPKLLDTPRLKDLKQKDIIKYARILLIIQISEENLIKLQESIDSGDMSKEMFDSVNRAQQEFRNNMDAEEKHLDKCEKYWSLYADRYGFESEEEKIVQETDTKDVEETRTILNMTDLTEQIHTIMNQKKLDDKNNND